METARKFRIFSKKSGADFGVYEGDTAEDAFAAMVADAGGPATDVEGRPLEGTMADWDFVADDE